MGCNVIGFKDCRIVDDFEYERYFQNVRKSYSEISNIQVYWKNLNVKEVMNQNRYTIEGLLSFDDMY